VHLELYTYSPPYLLRHLKLNIPFYFERIYLKQINKKTTSISCFDIYKSSYDKSVCEKCLALNERCTTNLMGFPLVCIYFEWNEKKNGKFLMKPFEGEKISIKKTPKTYIIWYRLYQLIFLEIHRFVFKSVSCRLFLCDILY
jgi:hypothetical protein